MTKKLFTCVLCECSSAGSEVVKATSDRSICTWCEHELKRLGRTRCRDCNTVKPNGAFGADPRRCRACRAAAQLRRYYANPAIREATVRRQRAVYAANPEAIRVKNRATWQRHRDRRIAAQRRFRAANPDHVRAQRQAWYQANGEAQRARKRAYHARRGRVLAKLRQLQRVRGER